MLPKIMWCLECEQEVLEKIHIEWFGVYEGEVMFDWCEGNYLCTCPPPDEPDWDYYLIEPTDEELELIEMEAQSLFLEL